jgi:ribonuclease R
MSQMEERIKAALGAEIYRPVVAQALAKQMKISKKAMPEFRTALDLLIETGHVREGKKGRLRLRVSAGFISGVVRRISSGAAFVIPSDSKPGQQNQDIYVSARDLRDAQTGDEVLVRVTGSRSSGQRSGQVEKIVERATSVFVGTYLEQGGQGFVRVDGTTFDDPIHVGDPGARGAVLNDKVVIEMVRFPSATRVGEAVLTKVLGQRGDPGVDTMSVIHSLGLPYEFSEEVLEDARVQAENFQDAAIGNRLDLTSETIITIDPVDARDFDDAISLTRSDDGHWHLGVHIADVAHFVTPGSPLDREARLRGTSVYLPRYVIPMLPEVISNGLASLQQGQLRYTKSALIEFDAQGSVLGVQLANSAIRVVRRFAYEEVMPIIQNPRQSFPNLTAPVRHLLERMHELAMILRKKRFSQGALEMGIPEVAIDFDVNGVVTGAHMRHHDESHEIIEEFMLAANVAVATLLASKNIPFLRRMHEDPDELKLRSFQEFCAGLGFELEQFQDRSEIQQLIRSVAGKPEERAVNFALLRSMKQARYSPEDAGHYALAEHDYCHFTSPIRRYPDLTIHRLVGELADRRTPVAEDPVTLAELGKRCSETERRAEKAERELIRIRLLRYMADRIGQEMDAIITGVENFGLFCQGIEIPAEGMIHSSALGDDFYQFDTATRTLTGQRTKREFRLGDPIRVVVARVDVDRRQLDLRVAESSKSTHAPGRVPRTSSSGRKKSDRENVSRSVSGSTNSGSTDSGSSKSQSTKSGFTKRSGKPHQPREQANPSSRSEPRDDQNHRGQKKSGQRKQAGKRAGSRGKKGKR